nr:MAG: hypothetical protein BECKTUN1418D_GA0071000_10388 [Candidatus Kentron sp. TUN]
MQEYENFKKRGSFVLSSDTEVQGELYLDGGKTILNLFSDRPFNTRSSQDILGSFYDHSKVSLIKCVQLNQQLGMNKNGCYCVLSIFPYFVLFGDEHIRSSDRVIIKLSFTVDDAAILFRDLGVFGEVIDARPHLERIAKQQEDGRKINIGEHPHLFYFSGKHEILFADTVLGKISVSHNGSYRLPDSEGIHVDNTIRINIAFESKKTVGEAISSVFDLLRFLEIIAGRPQNISRLSFSIEGDGEHPKTLDVYWCTSPRRDSDTASHKPYWRSLPIQGAEKPDEFAGVLKRWLERDNERRGARVRF